MTKDMVEVLLTAEEISSKISEIAERIMNDYAGKNPVFIGVLKGSFVFMADLMRKINLYCDIDFMAVSSYGNKSETTGAVKITKDLEQDIENRDVIVVEDILDSGLTLNYLMGYLKSRKPLSVRLCTLLDKPARRKVSIIPDYKGFDIPDAFVVGYGLDYAERYRNLPYIGVLKPEIYKE
ncbi:MAG: hypoxanthine phosphoribosyltransferase [Clostridiales bacterium]|jgi:hypoxanthine phosphoribosyltransferase|nr:hypoxanthine phosphoribosyltransferase [Clostridiales bacterium]